MIKKLLKPLCWLGFHFWGEYICTHLGDDYNKHRNTIRTCSICGRKQYKSDMISGSNYYAGVWKWLK